MPYNEKFEKYVSKMIKFYLKLKGDPELTSNKRFMRKRSECILKAMNYFPEEEQLSVIQIVAPDLKEFFLSFKQN